MAHETETSAAELLGNAFAAAAAAVFLTTPERVITAANAAAYAMLGYTPPNLAGRQQRMIYAASDDYVIVDAIIMSDASASANAAVPITLRDIRGALIDVNVIVLPVRNAKGKITAVIEIMTPAQPDATAIQNSSTRDHSAMLRFARGAAHDFKNFLTIIISNMELAKDAKRESQRQKFFDDAQHAGRRAASLAGQMIAFARDEPVAPEKIDVAKIIELQAPFLQASIGPAIQLSRKAAPGLHAIYADRSGLESALLNLVLNARDSIFNNGRITISADTATASFDSEGQVADVIAQHYVTITVSDTGAGMTDYVRQRAFDPFFSTKSASNGTGLGLATVMGFARQSNGHVTIESKLGSGTAVTLFLPPSPG